MENKIFSLFKEQEEVMKNRWRKLGLDYKFREFKNIIITPFEDGDGFMLEFPKEHFPKVHGWAGGNKFVYAIGGAFHFSYPSRYINEQMSILNSVGCALQDIEEAVLGSNIVNTINEYTPGIGLLAIRQEI